MHFLDNADKKYLSNRQVVFNKNIYKNITIFNVLTLLIFAVGYVIVNQDPYISAKFRYTALEVYY